MTNAPDEMQRSVLCVDMDGTLIKTDLLVESALQFLRKNPFRAWHMIKWLMQGRAVLKTRLADEVEIDASLLPLDETVVERIREERRKGKTCVLVTASAMKYAKQVAAHIGVFDEVYASEDRDNLSGKRKAEFLVEKFGEKGFDYIGNDLKDLAIWTKADTAIAANAPSHVIKALRAARPDAIILDPVKKSRIIDYFRAARPHQWAKNLLIFVPLITSHQFDNHALILTAGLAFASFSLAASAVYILNDLLDLPADRRHPRKKNRPIPAGLLDPRVCLLMAALLVTLAVIVGFSLSAPFALTLGIYLAVTTGYSVRLKDHVIIDVILLALLYTIRVIAGAVAISVLPSFWLLAFSMFLFFGLALVKRYTEILVTHNQAPSENKKIRGYKFSDVHLIASLGISSGIASVLVLALYINSAEIVILYKRPEYIWVLCPIMLYWNSRIWIKSHRGELHDDPVVFAMTDRNSLILGAIAAIAFTLATVLN